MEISYDEIADQVAQGDGGAKPPAPTYDSLASDAKGEEKSRLKQSMFVASREEPDRHARVMKLAEEARLHPRVVKSQFDKVKATVDQQKNDYDDLIERSPKLAAWLQDPDNASISRDDLNNLKGLEKQVAAHSKEASFSNIIMGGLNQMNSGLARIPGYIANMALLPGNLLNRALGMPEMAVPDAIINNPVAKMYDRYEEHYRPEIIDGNFIALAKDGKYTEAIKTYGAQLAYQGPQLATLMAGGVAGVGKQVLGVLGATTAATATAENAEAGVSPSTSAINATAKGAFEMAFESIPLNHMLKGMNKKLVAEVGQSTSRVIIGGITKEIVASSGINFTEEAATSFAQDLTDYVTGVNPNALNGIEERAFGAGLMGIGMGGPMGIVSGASQASQDLSVKRAKEFYLSMGETLEASKLRARLPKKQQELVENIVKETPVENIYIPEKQFEAYFQKKGLTPAEAAHTLGVQKEYEQAKETGSDIKIPLSQFADKFVGTEHYQGLADDVKFSENAQTINEAKELKKQQEELANQELPPEVIEENQSFQEESDQIISHFEKQLVDSGATPQVAAAQSQIMRGFFVAAQRAYPDQRLSPMELYNKYALKVGAVSEVPGQEVLQQSQPVISSDEVIAHHEQFTTMPVQDHIREKIRTIPRWKKESISLDSLEERSTIGSIVERYQEMDSPAPAIIVSEDGSVLDGAHRVAAARARGMDEIEAYVPAGDIFFQKHYSSQNQRIGQADHAMPENVSIISGTVPTSMDIKQAKDYGKQNFQGKAFVNKHTNLPISVAGNELNKSVDGPDPFSRLVARANLDKALAQATYKHIESDPVAGELHVFYAPMQTEQNKFLVRIRTKKQGDGFKFFDQRVEKLPSVSGSDVQNVTGGDSSSMSIADLDAAINSVRQSDTHFQENSGPPKGYYQKATQFIGLLPQADLSTFLHESGHFYLEMLGDLADAEGSSEQIKADFQVTLDWLGVKNRSEIAREHHEKWARGFEAYLREGKAPSGALKKAFNSFRIWLTNLYRHISQLDVNLSDEVRGVMDRLLATDDEIEAVRREQGLTSLTADDLKTLGFTDQQAIEYQSAQDAARFTATEELTEKAVNEIERETKAWWIEEHEEKRQSFITELSALPVYRALARLAEKGPANKFNRQALVDLLGEERAGKLPQNISQKNGTLHPDVLAESLGLSSGDELIQAIESAEDLDEMADRLADQAMKREHGDMMNDGSLKEEAAKAVQNEKQGALLHLELKHLAQHNWGQFKKILRKVTSPVPTQEQIRDWAENTIQETTSKEISPYKYQRAAAKAAREAREAFLKGDMQAAFDAKLRELKSHELYRAAQEAKAALPKIKKYMREVSKKDRRARIGKAGEEWLAQLDDILVRFSFKGFASTEKARGIMDWAKEVEETTGQAPVISDYILDEANRAHFTEIPYGDLVAIYDTVKSIEHTARRINEVRSEQENIEKSEAIDKLVTSIHKNIPGEKPLPETDKVYGEAESFWKITKGFLGSLIRPEKIIERMDGGKQGIWHKLFWDMSAQAEVKKSELREKVMAPLAEQLTKMPKDRQARMNERVHLKGLGKSLTRRTLIGVALNTGNLSNRNKMLEGGMWFGEEWRSLTEEDMSEILNHLDQKDWDLVQSMWDAVDLLYPDLNDLNKRAVGLPLNRIKASPVITKYGEFRGGYWPAVGDPRHTKIGEKQENQDAMVSDVFGPRYPKAATRHSFREARTKAAYPLQLDWQRVLSSHVDKAITDIAYHEWAMQSRRLLENQRIKKAIQNRLGEAAYRSLEDWLVHQVQPIAGGYKANADVESFQSKLISNTAIAALGFNVMVAAQNMILGPIQAGHQIGKLHMANAFRKFLSNPRKAYETVHAVSGAMKYRHENLDQSFNDLTQSLEGKTSFRANVARWSMAIHMWADKQTSTVLWMAKFQQEIDKGPKEAARLADKTIRTTQTAGGAKDLSSFERDSRYKPLKMFIGPMLVMLNEQVGAVAGKGPKALLDPKVMSTFLHTGILPALLFPLIMGRGPDEDEDFMKWSMMQILFYPFQMVPLVRDAAAVVQASLLGKPSYSRMNPVADVAMGIGKAAQKAFDDDADLSDKVGAVFKASGPLFGIPTNQALKTTGFVMKLAEGEEEVETPFDYAQGLATGKTGN